MASKCRKFVPNMFNKSKCQACFGSKEAHSAEALENNKASRKVSKCGYLFVAPNFDFSNPLDRTRRWQRRFFRLYDDGELTFCVDDHADTVPQGSVDMNKCTDIQDAEVLTSHTNSIAVVTPDKTEYFKADSKEEIQWWHDVLVEFPNRHKALKTRRKPNFISNKENVQPQEDGSVTKEPVTQGRFEVEKVLRQPGLKGGDMPPSYATFKGVRSLKHKYDKNHQEGMRKSSSLHDLSSQDKDLAPSLASSRFLSCSGDRLDVLSSGGGGGRGDNKSVGGAFSVNPYFTIPRTSWPCRVHPSTPLLTAPAAHPALFNSSSSISSTSSNNSATRRGSFEERSLLGQRAAALRERPRHSRERSASLKDFPTLLTLPRESGGSLESMDRRAASVGSALGRPAEADDLSQSMSADETDSNETDELKMARSSEISASNRAHPSSASSNPEASPTSKYEDLTYLKKGWLIKQGQSDRESRKHWFVLGGNSLKYYKDAKAEESNSLDGRIDLSTCYEVSEVTTLRNYGFKIKTRNGEYVLAAMTSGIRHNWMKAVRLCMDLHSSPTKRGLSTSLTGKALANLSAARTTDDFDTRAGVASANTTSTAMVTGAKGETAFQLVGRREPGKRENRNVRRHHSDVNPGNVSKMFSVKEFSANLDQPDTPLPPPPPSASAGSAPTTGEGQRMAPASITHDTEKVEPSPRASKIPRHHSPSSESFLHSSSTSSLPLKRYVEGSDSMAVAAPVLQGAESRRSKRNITSESNKEEEKRELMRRAKSPSARVKEKSRAAKTPRLHSPPPDEDGLDYHRSSGSGQTDSSQLMSDAEDDMDMTLSSEEHYLVSSHDELDGGHAESVGDGMMVELLESEVESLKERLDHTQSQLVKMHESNIDLKSRLQKETAQSLDSSFSSGHSGRWSQQPPAPVESAQVQTLKRQLKESKETVQKQCKEIEKLSTEVDLAHSRLAGTEKALADALKDYKLEKEKFLKFSADWNRRVRILEDQLKDNTHKLEHTRDNLLTKERECRRLELEARQHQQKTREQDREILKLKAVEHEYNQLKEQLDNKDRELIHAHAELREKDSRLEKVKSQFTQQVGELEREFGQERDDLENHLEEVKRQLCSAQDRQCSMEDSMTSGVAHLLTEKDDTIAQLEEKLIENDRKMVDMQEELQAEMGENSELVHNMDVLQEEKQQLQGRMDCVEKKVIALKEQVSDLEKDNHTLRVHLDQLKEENAQLTAFLRKTPAAAPSDPEKEMLESTIEGLNKQIQGLQLKLMERLEDSENGLSTGSEQDNLLHNILILDSDLKEINILLKELHNRFDIYISTVSNDSWKEASALSDMVGEIGQRCLQLQESLQQGTPGEVLDGSGMDYTHTVTVNAGCSSTAILEEYRGLKGKFDRVVAELKKLKKDLNEAYSSCSSLEQRDKQREKTIGVMEDSYKQQMESLLQRVDHLSSHLAPTVVMPATRTDHPTPPPCPDDPSSQDISQQLSLLDSRILQMEKTLAEVPLQQPAGNPHPEPCTPSGDSPVMSRLKDMNQQLEKASRDLKDIVKDLPASNPSLASQQQALASRLDSCGQTLDRLTHAADGNWPPGNGPPGNPHGDNPGHSLGCKGGCPEVMESSASSMERCMHEVIDRIQEIGEQLDCLEDGAEDSDDDEEEATTIDDVREHLASLCEYVKQHSRFSDHDWRLMQLLSAQKAVISKDRLENLGSDAADGRDRLQAYADRLSLESLILVEMSHLLQRDTEEEEERDPVMHEVSVLNSKVLSLYQKLDKEMRTLCVTGTSADILRVQADILAEKIMVEGRLCAGSFSQDSHLGEEDAREEPEKKAHHKLLASEAILRSQLDSYIGHNLDKSCDELWSSASHVTTRSLVQGELTFALNSLKKQLDVLHVSQPAVSARDFSFQRLKDRHKAVMEVAQAYQDKMIQALAIIISKESEEMTIVEGPENVLEAVCSEVSTIMEKHIQRYKEKVRTASDTQTAHRWDMMVNQLRADREIVLTGIRKQHTAFASDPDSEAGIEVPFQTLDSSINNFGEVMALRSILCAHLDFIVELLKMGDTALLAEMVVGDEDERGEEEENDDDHRALRRGLSTFVHNLAEALKAEAQSKQSQVDKMLSEHGVSPTALPSVPHPKNASAYCDTLSREAVFAAQTTFMMFKQKLLHQQEMDALKAARPARSRPFKSAEKDGDGMDGEEGDMDPILAPLEEVLDTKHDDEMETLRVIASLVGTLEGVVSGQDWGLVEEHVRQLEQKVQAELELARQRHEVHLDLFKQEESKVEHMWEESQQERDHFEARCSDLEEELRSVSNLHDDEVERMRQDVMTAVSAIRANEEESETQLSDKVQDLTKQMLLQKETYKRFLRKMKGQLAGANQEDLVHMVNKELSGVTEHAELPEDEEVPPLPSQPPPDAPHSDDKALNMEEELELLKKEKDEALAEETRNTKAALDAMRKAYEEELQHERQKYRECLTTMYNEDFVNEIRRRHEGEVEKTQEELKQVKMHYMSKCEDLKLLEVKLGQTKQDYESHINQLIKSNDHLDDMVNQEIERLKDFIKNRPANLTTGSATMEEELYDAQIMIRVKDAELQKLRSQVKNFENSLHRTTEEHRQTMTQYLQALKENQEMRKDYQTEADSLREQLDKALHESGARRPIRRAPSFHQRARSPSPTVAAPHRRDSTSATTEHVSRDSNRRRRIDPKDLRRSKSSPSLPYIFDPKGIATSMKSPGKGDRRQMPKP